MFKVITLMFCFIWSNLVYANNQDPIVLAHGFSGWGRDEMLGFRYWGAKHKHHDIHQLLNQEGYKTFTAAVGPFSSNWDRAVELYHQIKVNVLKKAFIHSGMRTIKFIF